MKCIPVIRVTSSNCLFSGPFNNFVTLSLRGGEGVKRCVTERSQSNFKKHYEGGMGGGVKNRPKKR